MKSLTLYQLWWTRLSRRVICTTPHVVSTFISLFISNTEHISWLCNDVTGGGGWVVATPASVSTCSSLLPGKDAGSHPGTKITPQLCLFHILPVRKTSAQSLQSSRRFHKLHTGSVRYKTAERFLNGRPAADWWTRSKRCCWQENDWGETERLHRTHVN